MSDLHQKFIKMFIWVGILNLAVAGFGSVTIFNNISDAKYGLAVFHATLVAVNIWVAWLQVKNVKRVKQQAKDEVWAILSSKEIG